MLSTCADVVSRCVLKKMSSRYTLNSCIQGFHVYKDIWIGETLLGKPEFGNIHDPYAVAVVSSAQSAVDTIVGHLPRNISTMCHIFLRRAGNIIVQVTGRRRRSIDLPQEVPCLLTLKVRIYQNSKE